MGLSRLPESLVMRRWTVCAKAAEGSGADDGYRHAPPDLVALHSILYNASMELISMGRESRQAFEVALSFVAKAKEAISSMSVVHPSLVQPPPCSERSDPIRERDEADQLKGVVAPPHVRSRGRPRQRRFKSPVESPGAHKRNRPSARENVSDVFSSVETFDGDVDEDSRTKPDVQPGSGLFCSGGKSGKRSCHLCGEKGHYKSTCGRKSTYTAK